MFWFLCIALYPYVQCIRLLSSVFPVKWCRAIPTEPSVMMEMSYRWLSCPVWPVVSVEYFKCS